MKTTGTIALAFVLIFAALLFFMLSSCALTGDGSVPATDREGATVFALVDAGVIVAGIWGIRRLNRGR